MAGKKPTKPELAQIKVMAGLGHAPTAIAKQMGKSHHTVIKYLQEHNEIYQDPEVQELIAIIKKREIADLRLLGAKARANLHRRFDEGSPNVIESVATMDRTFQQRRLLEGQSTQNVDCRTVIQKADEEIEALKAELCRRGVKPEAEK